MAGLVVEKCFLLKRVNQMISMVIPFAIEPHRLEDMMIAIDDTRFEQFL